MASQLGKRRVAEGHSDVGHDSGLGSAANTTPKTRRWGDFWFTITIAVATEVLHTVCAILAYGKFARP